MAVTVGGDEAKRARRRGDTEDRRTSHLEIGDYSVCPRISPDEVMVRAFAEYYGMKTQDLGHQWCTYVYRKTSSQSSLTSPLIAYYSLSPNLS